MAEMLIAVVILGIGLLITSSMFPIAWLKARDVAEMTALPACTETASVHLDMLMRASGPVNYSASNPFVRTSFFPGDWVGSPAIPPNERYRAAIYPDRRVHHLNMGNYLARDVNPNDGLPDSMEPDWLNFSGSTELPVADNTWTLDEVIAEGLRDSTVRDAIAGAVLHAAQVAPHVRMYPPLDAAPASSATAQEKALWLERLEKRRYVWSVFYRFGELPGPDPALRHELVTAGTGEPQLLATTDSSLRQSRLINLYFFTLKRPASARYARQEGANPTTNLTWSAGRRTDAPTALPPEFDVLMPAPWRIEALVTTATMPDCSLFMDNNPNNDPARSGIPTEIEISNLTISDLVQQGTYLLDDRTGEVFRVTARKNVPGNPARATLVLDKEYNPSDLCLAPEFNPEPPTTEDNYLTLAAYVDCTRDPNNICAQLATYLEDEPERRFYWVFPPPVDAQRGPGGIPIFNGSQPVVGVEVRQMIIDPKL